jgi:proline dehydrogenase
MGVLDRIALAALPVVPTRLMRMMSLRYIAGERLEQAVERLAGLTGEGFRGALDILGEDVASETEARGVAGEYAAAADALRERKIDAYISIKPTHLGLRLSEELAHELYCQLVQHVDTLNSFVRIEMEDHTTTDATLRIFERIRESSPQRLGVALQSRLLRTSQDIDALSEGPLNVRMVKGVYLEPARIAHTDPTPIREAYLEGTRRLWERGAFVALATHDELMAKELVALAKSMGIGQDQYEFQVLLGVRTPLWRAWRDAGHPVRVYVPFGPNWRAYSTRRLKKNPEIFRHLLKDLVRR